MSIAKQLAAAGASVQQKASAGNIRRANGYTNRPYDYIYDKENEDRFRNYLIRKTTFKEKIMGFFTNGIKRFIINTVRDYSSSPVPERKSNKLYSNESLIESNQSIAFRVHHANGGHIIELRKYDLACDTSRSELYVIDESEDLGASISKIITMEALK